MVIPPVQRTLENHVDQFWIADARRFGNSGDFAVPWHQARERVDFQSSSDHLSINLL